MLRAAILDDTPHGFSTRDGPEPGSVLPQAPLVLSRQVHSPTVVTVSGPWTGTVPKADALVTATPGVLIGVVTADCCPVLFADRTAGVVGAAHAGWRGAVGGVLENTLAAMEALGARRDSIAAAIGPTIAQRSYEVDAALKDRFPPAADRFFLPGGAGHWQFDLPGYVTDHLRASGLRAIEDLAEDTYAQCDRFFSFRRATHRGQPTGGRQTSVIALA